MKERDMLKAAVRFITIYVIIFASITMIVFIIGGKGLFYMDAGKFVARSFCSLLLTYYLFTNKFLQEFFDKIFK